MRVRGVEFCKAQRGWCCTIWFLVTTARQFTDEVRYTTAGSRFWFLAYWWARRAASRLHNELSAKPGERTRLGWG